MKGEGAVSINPSIPRDWSEFEALRPASACIFLVWK